MEREVGVQEGGDTGSILQHFLPLPGPGLPSRLSLVPTQQPPHHLGKKTCQQPQDSESQWSVKPMQATHAPK